MQLERRKFIRFNIPLDVEFKKLEEGARFCSGRTLNFSRAGMCLQTQDTAPELGDAVELSVKLPDKDIYVHALGDIVWIEQYDEQCLVGLKLVAMNQEAKFDILNYCENVQVKKSSDDIFMQ